MRSVGFFFAVELKKGVGKGELTVIQNVTNTHSTSP